MAALSWIKYASNVMPSTKMGEGVNSDSYKAKTSMMSAT